MHVVLNVKGVLKAAAVLLIATGIAKVAGIFVPGAGQGMPSPLFPALSARDLLTLSAMLEFMAAYILLSKHSDLLKAEVLAGVASLFLGYRVALAWSGQTAASCRCLGIIPEMLSLDPTFNVWASNVVLLFLLFAGYGLIVIHAWRTHSNSVEAEK
jgi:hypothetical protein